MHSAQAVLRNRALLIDIYLLTYYAMAHYDTTAILSVCHSLDVYQYLHAAVPLTGLCV